MSDVPTFKDRSFDDRMVVMGDLAEGVCSRHLDDIGRSYVATGLNRPPIRMDMLPARIRHIPDFLTSKGWIECKGFGRDQIAKLKIEDFNCFNFWNDMHPLEMFFYDSYHERYGLIEWETCRDMVGDGRVSLGAFPEGKPYFAIPAEVIFDAI